jgi:hypothetical protein
MLDPFLDRTVAARRHEKPAESATGIIPGNRGKVGRNWCGRPLLQPRAAVRHVSPVPLDGVATDPVLRQRSCAARREVETASEPSQVQGQFRALHRCSYPEGYGCYCTTSTLQHVREASKPPKGPAGLSGWARKGHAVVWNGAGWQQPASLPSLGRFHQSRSPNYKSNAA